MTERQLEVPSPCEGWSVALTGRLVGLDALLGDGVAILRRWIRG